MVARIFFTMGNAVRFFSNELLQIENLRGVVIETSTDEYPRNNFGGSLSMAPRFQQNVVLPKSLSLNLGLDQCAQYPSKHKPSLYLGHCEVVYTLCIQVWIL